MNIKDLLRFSIVFSHLLIIAFNILYPKSLYADQIFETQEIYENGSLVGLIVESTNPSAPSELLVCQNQTCSYDNINGKKIKIKGAKHPSLVNITKLPSSIRILARTKSLKKSINIFGRNFINKITTITYADYIIGKMAYCRSRTKRNKKYTTFKIIEKYNNDRKKGDKTKHRRRSLKINIPQESEFSFECSKFKGKNVLIQVERASFRRILNIKSKPKIFTKDDLILPNINTPIKTPTTILPELPDETPTISPTATPKVVRTKTPTETPSPTSTFIPTIFPPSTTSTPSALPTPLPPRTPTINSGPPHPDNKVKQSEHIKFLDLAKKLNFTHIADSNGSWFDSETWKNGTVPNQKSIVLIPPNINVIYDSESNVRIKTIVIKGNLSFSNNSNTRLYVETILNMPEGSFTIGTKSNSVPENITSEIIFTSDNSIQDLVDWDPSQLSKGLISHGSVEIYGSKKVSKLPISGDAKAGSSTITLDGDPIGWKVGDKVVLGGTSLDRTIQDRTDRAYFRDEVLTITGISGRKISFTNDDIISGTRNILKFDHVRPNIPEKSRINIYIANITRNISFSSEHRKETPIKNRAHIMFMHSPKVKVYNAGFYELGRSDKSKIVDDVEKNVDGTIGNGENPRGRYALHFHRNGASNLLSQPAIASGNAVVGSPGWGIVHHDSHVILENNVVFDVIGSGIAAETGNEIGIWKNNIVIKTSGSNERVFEKLREKLFDHGANGEGFWVQGAGQIRMEDNISISSNRAVVIFGDSLKAGFKDKETINISDLALDTQKLFIPEQKEAELNDIPLTKFSGFQAYNTGIGIQFWGHLTNQDGEGSLAGSLPEPKSAHNGRTIVENFVLWGIRNKGAMTLYSSSIDFINGLVISSTYQRPMHLRPNIGLSQNVGASRIRYKSINVQGFGEGIEVQYPVIGNNQRYASSSIMNSIFNNNTYNLKRLTSGSGLNGDFSSHMILDKNQFNSSLSNIAPTSAFEAEPIGKLGILFDGSNSFDIDQDSSSEYNLPSKGIATYAWDLDGDGIFDKFGRTVKHYFRNPGVHEVSLTVFDNQGEPTTKKASINVTDTAYKNLFSNGDFSNEIPKTGANRTSSGANLGWQVVRGKINSGSLLLSGENFGSSASQVVEDLEIRRGKQKFSYKLINLEGNLTNPKSHNEVVINLWGVNGQFEANGNMHAKTLSKIGTLPMTYKLLSSDSFGKESKSFFDWREISHDIDFGNGFEYIFIQISTKNSNNTGDLIAIDDITIVD